MSAAYQKEKTRWKTCTNTRRSSRFVFDLRFGYFAKWIEVLTDSIQKKDQKPRFSIQKTSGVDLIVNRKMVPMRRIKFNLHSPIKINQQQNQTMFQMRLMLFLLSNRSNQIFQKSNRLEKLIVFTLFYIWALGDSRIKAHFTNNRTRGASCVSSAKRASILRYVAIAI